MESVMTWQSQWQQKQHVLCAGPCPVQYTVLPARNGSFVISKHKVPLEALQFLIAVTALQLEVNEH